MVSIKDPCPTVLDLIIQLREFPLDTPIVGYDDALHSIKLVGWNGTVFVQSAHRDNRACDNGHVRTHYRYFGKEIKVQL